MACGCGGSLGFVPTYGDASIGMFTPKGALITFGAFALLAMAAKNPPFQVNPRKRRRR